MYFENFLKKFDITEKELITLKKEEKFLFPQAIVAVKNTEISIYSFNKK